MMQTSNAVPAEANLTTELLQRARSEPDAIAIVSAQRSIDYRMLDALVWGCAQWLSDRGIRPGTVVALTILDPLTQAVALLAVARLGATCLPLPASSGSQERHALASRAGAAWFATDRPERFDTGLPELVVDLGRIAAESRRLEPGILNARPEAPWQIVRGSGSTGAPKLIPVTHAQSRRRALMQVESYGVTREDCLGSLSGFDFNTGRQVLIRALLAGARCAILADGHVGPLTLAARLGVTQLGISVFHAERILGQGHGDELAAIVSLEALLIGGSTVSTDLRKRLRDVIGDRLWVLYGTNEASILTLSKAPEVFEVEGTVGRPLAGVRLEIVDAQDRALPSGQVGFVRVWNPGGIEHYLGDAEADRRQFRDGWFHPGDLGRMTADGQLIYYGRADHMMIFNGINIYPAEIEQALSSHPAVSDVAVVPFRSKTHQDVPVAAVALRTEVPAGVDALLAHARARLGARGPARIAVLDAIPRNEQGKLIRAELTRLLRERLSPG